MADIKSAQQLLKDVPRNDALKALQEITDWVESVRDNSDFHLDQRLDVLSLLDESARTFMRKLMREYFASTAPSKFQENRSWMVLNAFFAQIEQAYSGILLGYRNGEKGSAAIRAAMPLVAARGIYAVMGRLKCAAARYALVDSALWIHLAEYYSFAEAQQSLDEPVTLYPGWATTTTVRNRFASLVMWYAPGASTLSPLHVHLVERLSNYLCRHFTVDPHLSTGSLFCFDLAHPAMPIRVMPDTNPLISMRFLSAGIVRPQIDNILNVLRKGVVPEEINLGGVYEAVEVRDVTHNLLIFWGSPPPMRRNARHPIKVSVNVAHGLTNVFEHGEEEKKSGNNQFDDTESGFGIQTAGARDAVSMSWAVEDISAGGFRCVLPSKNAEGVRIGSLIGIKPDNVEFRGVGIVRRMIRDGQSNLHVGVEMLSKHVEKVKVRSRGVSKMGGGEQAALWLIRPGDDVGSVWLLMVPDSFSMSVSLETKFEGKAYLLIPVALLEKGVDYDLAHYRKVEEDPNAASDAY